MSINPNIFKAYDIRGVYPTDIDEAGCEIIIRSIYHFFKSELKKDNITIALGRDMRVSSPSLFEVAKRTLAACGATVVDIGLASTPTFYFAVAKYGCDGGIDITASHNPKEYAGIKFVRRDGDKIVKIGKSTGMGKVREMALRNDFPPYVNTGKVVEKTDVLDDEIEDALSEIDISKIKHFKIACDPANGMGSLYIQKLFEKIPGELVKMNFELDGTFPAHPADPLDFKNLRPLQKKVREIGADLGLEPDGDGDRIFFIDEQSEIIPATSISSLIAREILKKHPNEKIIVDIRYIRNVENAVKKYGGQTLISKVGHAFITEDVNREQAFFAGESSGHFYFRDNGGAESAIKVILYVLATMSETGKPISEILKSLRTSYESGEYNFKVSDTSKLIAQIKEQYNDGELSLLDGISISYPDWRFNIRISNTEPLLRLNVEANSKETLEINLNKLLTKLQALGATRK